MIMNTILFLAKAFTSFGMM